jgi:hypothetical protein
VANGATGVSCSKISDESKCIIILKCVVHNSNSTDTVCQVNFPNLEITSSY